MNHTHSCDEDNAFDASHGVAQIASMLNNQRVVVIGGTAGIGFGVAKAAVRDGAQVVVASSKKENVERAVRELGKSAEGHVYDLNQASAAADFFGRIGAFDHLAYTAAGALHTGLLADLDLDAARAYLEGRYFGVLKAVKAAVKTIHPGGSITLTSGTAGRRPMPGWSVIASLCTAMEGLTRQLAVELAPVRVNLVIPGLVDTGLWSSMDPQAVRGLFESTAKKLPVGRVGQADDIAEHYLAFMRGSYTTGQSVVVDGGGVLV
jgi:NAD(P)-dependent dehydrogenase (short-subunit alcohol dehydrogenase family)